MQNSVPPLRNGTRFFTIVQKNKSWKGGAQSFITAATHCRVSYSISIEFHPIPTHPSIHTHTYTLIHQQSNNLITNHRSPLSSDNHSFRNVDIATISFVRWRRRQCCFTSQPTAPIIPNEFVNSDGLFLILRRGFQDEIHEIVKTCPIERQTLLFSATMGTKVDDLIKLSLKRPLRTYPCYRQEKQSRSERER